MMALVCSSSPCSSTRWCSRCCASARDCSSTASAAASCRRAAAGVGAAALIALSQLSTYVSPLAPATPYLMAAAALAGFALGWAARALARSDPRHRRGGGWRLCPYSPICSRSRPCCSPAGRASPPTWRCRLGGAHDRRGLPHPPRPGLLAPGSAQLLRAVHQQLLQHQLSLGRGHAVRRQRAPVRTPPDLGLPAVQRVHARDRLRARLWLLARRIGLLPRVGGAGRAQRDRARARLRATSCSARSRRSRRWR